MLISHLAMYPQFVIEAIYFGIISVVVVFIIVFYILTRRGGREVEADAGHGEKPGMEKGERNWMLFLFSVALIGNILFLSPLLPSARNAFYEPKPATTITIHMKDYSFHLPETPIVIPANTPVEFVVISGDLVYGFGVFRKDGSMVFQMQVVPKPYVNRIVWVFDEPGAYDIRSTEYSGPQHPWMFVPDAIIVEGGKS
ncbi:MAG: hypothetical protein QXM16_01455 [Nitrososphaerota archaeon]